MHAYRSDLAAASERIAALEDQLAERERAVRSSDRGRRVAMVAGFLAVTAAAALWFSRTPERAARPAATVDSGVGEAPPESTPRWSPVMQRLREKVKNGSASDDERDALAELRSLTQQLTHAQRKSAALRRLAEGRADAKDRSFLHQSCVLAGDRECRFLMAGTMALRDR